MDGDKIEAYKSKNKRPSFSKKIQEVSKGVGLGY